MIARPYQIQCHDQVLREWGHAPWWDGERPTFRTTIANAPTGSGKTIVAAMLAKTIEELGGRLLFVADREELIQQPLRKFHEAAGIIAGLHRAGDRASAHARTVIASVQTLARRLPAGPPFTHIIDDEAHRNSDLRKKVHDAYPQAKILGVTATAFRSGMADLSKWYESVAFELGVFDLIDQGYLTPISVLTVPLEVDISKVKKAKGKDEFDVNGLDAAIEPYYRAIAQIIKEHAKERTILAFLPLIKSSQQFVEVLQNEGISARHCDGGSPDRADILECFERGDFQVLSNSQVFSTGVDFIRADCLLNLSPTKSEVEYRQRAGRVLRLPTGLIDGVEDQEERKQLIATGRKPNALILDVLWQTDKLKLCGPATLIVTNEDDQFGMEERVKKQRSPEDMAEISRQYRLDKEEKLRKAIEEAAAEQARRGMRTASLQDARQLMLTIHDQALMDFIPAMPWEKKAVTAKQAELLERRGINPETVGSAGLAGKIIDIVSGRQKAGLAPVQAFAQLQAAGITDPSKTTLDDAIRALGHQFPMTFGKKYCTTPPTPLCKVSRGFWDWLMFDAKATGARDMCQREHPAVYRYMINVVFKDTRVIA